ncbi:hypothetical protein PIB30_005595 [Stylosanthes scabra]|uniref:Uncharacterized protein n=1 Tax=Stylosanthes scabra TaxID=79078 RepID=A0ABU6R3X5_9FABA|nr:hypothetical protein [Stylosanthes scabra]
MRKRKNFKKNKEEKKLSERTGAHTRVCAYAPVLHVAHFSEHVSRQLPSVSDTSAGQVTRGSTGFAAEIRVSNQVNADRVGSLAGCVRVGNMRGSAEGTGSRAGRQRKRVSTLQPLITPTDPTAQINLAEGRSQTESGGFRWRMAARPATYGGEVGGRILRTMGGVEICVCGRKITTNRRRNR